jgi:hypothetical protein
MDDSAAILYGELASWPSKGELVELLRRAGLDVDVGRYSVRVENCSHFAFQEYGGDLGEPRIEADAATPEAMIRDAKLVSEALTAGRIRHRFEIYDSGGTLNGYLHFDWPRSFNIDR